MTAENPLGAYHLAVIDLRGKQRRFDSSRQGRNAQLEGTHVAGRYTWSNRDFERDSAIWEVQHRRCAPEYV